jgi:hypothetical protein
MEDMVAIYLGPTVFRIGRLLTGVLATVHLFACAYWRVKVYNIYVYVYMRVKVYYLSI